MRSTLALAALAASCLACVPACTGTRADRPTVGVTIPLEVRKGDFVARFLATGELEAVRADDLVVPRMPSWETSIRWMEADGSLVKAGQKVVEFDDTAFGRDLEEKKLARDQARSDLDQKEADVAATLEDREFQVAQRRYALDKARSDAEVPAEILPQRDWQERQLALERAGVEHQKALEELEAARTFGEEEIVQRRITLEKAEREIATAEGALASMVLFAPRDGLLVHADHPWEGRKLQIGDTVWVGLTIAKLPDLSRMRVKVKLSDVDDGRIAPGMKAVCSLDAWPEERFEARLDEITPVAQEAERMSLRRAFDASFTLERTDPERMRPGMSVKVEVEAARRLGVLLIPRATLDLESRPPRALVDGGDPVEVTLGECNAADCVLESGLNLGARLRRRS